MSENKITITFVYPDKVTKKECVANVGETILQVAHKNDVPVEGACEGSLACSTCHIIVKPEQFQGDLSVKSIEEEDMLDLAFDLQPTSRLGCQVKLNASMDGLVLFLPSGSRNFCCGSGCEA